MTKSIRDNSLSRRLRLSRLVVARKLTIGSAARAAILIAILSGVIAYVPQNAQSVRSAEDSQDCAPPGARVDLAFIIDRSGSFDVKLVGQAYNVQIEGVLRALRDPSVIPRDGSVAVTVETFAGSGTIQVPFKQIDTAADAEAIAAMVESLRCTAINCTPAGSCPVFGSNPASNYAPAITTANDHLNQNHRPGARQVLLLSSDGEPSDLKDAVDTAQRVGRAAPARGVQFELDLILLARQAQRCDDFGAEINKIVFPQPACELPGAVLAIGIGACNKPCASLDDSAVKADCDRQVKEFAELTRRVLRSQPATRFLTVNTFLDTAPATPIGSTLSLRQAIEFANSNCGATTITFDASLKNATIRPNVPLPALIAPDIRICGCDEMNCGDLMDTEKKCDPFLTIDGRQTDTTMGEQHSDGILIRANHDVVRGLRIICFKGAGVGIDPGARDPSRITDDLPANVGFNLITRNVFEKNVKAGVRVIDPPAFGETGISISHNIGNTISMNDILGSETPIDLGGDGPTPNDPDDLDQGPNTLLNFPASLSVIALPSDVSATASGVTFTGQVNGPTAAGATVEIFAITSFRVLVGGVRGRLIDGVTFLTRTTTSADGSFNVVLTKPLPCCYTATVTDLAGNTSELMFPGGGLPNAKVTDVTFGAAAPNLQLPQTKPFTIENTGCAPLIVSLSPITRVGFSRKKGNDGFRFSIEPQGVGSGGETIIEAGQVKPFTVTFTPLIPVAVSPVAATSALLLLPETINSTVTLARNGCIDSNGTLSLTAHVDTQVKLIDPNSPRGPNALVTLTRSGDRFTVTFAVYDSNLDVERVTYQFLDKSGGTVPLNQPLTDLSGVIRNAGVVTGQSFRVIQPFSNAKQHPEVASVLVTVFEKQGPPASASGSLTSRTAAARIQTSLRPRWKELVLPVIKLTPALNKNALPEKDLPISKTQSRGAGTPRAGEEKEKRQ